jgi:hypothetical protein
MLILLPQHLLRLRSHDDDPRRHGAALPHLAEAHVGEAGVASRQVDACEERGRRRARDHQIELVLLVDAGGPGDLPRAVALREEIVEAQVAAIVEQVRVDEFADQHHGVGLEHRAVAGDVGAHVAEPVIMVFFRTAMARHGD